MAIYLYAGFLCIGCVGVGLEVFLLIAWDGLWREHGVLRSKTNGDGSIIKIESSQLARDIEMLYGSDQ